MKSSRKPPSAPLSVTSISTNQRKTQTPTLIPSGRDGIAPLIPLSHFLRPLLPYRNSKLVHCLLRHAALRSNIEALEAVLLAEVGQPCESFAVPAYSCRVVRIAHYKHLHPALAARIEILHHSAQISEVHLISTLGLLAQRVSQQLPSITHNVVSRDYFSRFLRCDA